MRFHGNSSGHCFGNDSGSDGAKAIAKYAMHIAARIKSMTGVINVVSVNFIMERRAVIVLLAISTVLGGCLAINERRMPYQVVVRHEIVDREVLDCSGVILGPRHILSTAKCVEYIGADELSIKYSYAVGGSVYKTVEIADIVKHPDFVGRFYANNVAVLVTKTAMEFKANVAEAIGLVGADEEEIVAAFASGWGVNAVRQILALQNAPWSDAFFILI